MTLRALLLALSLVAVSSGESLRFLRPLDQGWRFAPESAVGANGWERQPPATARPVTLPHRLPEGLPAGWYFVEVSPQPDPDRPHVHLVLDGVGPESRVWLDGQPLAEHAGLYAPFSIDVSNLLKPGRENRIAVRVETKPGEPGGLVRPVTLRYTAPVYVERALVSATPTGPGQTRLRVSLAIRNAMDNTANVWIDLDVLDPATGRVVANPETHPALGTVATVPPEVSQTVEIEADLPGLIPWQPGAGRLYDLRVRTQKNVEGLEPKYRDEAVFSFGVREPGPDLAKWTGLLLAPYPLPQAQLDRADREGRPILLRLDGTASSPPSTLADLVAAYANHPSIVAWVAGVTPAGERAIRAADPTRPILKPAQVPAAARPFPIADPDSK